MATLGPAITDPDLLAALNGTPAANGTPAPTPPSGYVPSPPPAAPALPVAHMTILAGGQGGSDNSLGPTVTDPGTLALLNAGAGTPVAAPSTVAPAQTTPAAQQPQMPNPILSALAATNPIVQGIVTGAQTLAQARPDPNASDYKPSILPMLNPVGAFANRFVDSLPIVGPTLSRAGNSVDAFINNMIPGMQQETPQQVAQMNDAQDRAFPAYSGAGQIAGPTAGYALAAGALPAAFGVAPGMGLLAQMGAGAGSTMGVSALDNMARGQNPAQAVGNAVVPGLVGGLIPGGAAALKGIGRSVANRFTAPSGLSQYAMDLMRPVFEADNSVPGAASANIARGGPTAMAADSGVNARSLLDESLQHFGPAANDARTAIQDRAGAAQAQVEAALDKHLGQPLGMTETSAMLKAGSQKLVNATYKAAYAHRINWDSAQGEQLSEVLKRVPASLLQRAGNMMRMEGLDPMTGERVGGFEMKDGDVYVVPKHPSPQQLDYVKRALKDASEESRGKGKGGAMTNEGRIQGNLADDLRDAVSAADPAYGQALRLAADPISRRVAANFGTTLLSSAVPMDEARAIIGKMSKGELDSLKSALNGQIREVMANVRAAISDPNVSAREAATGLNMLSSKAAQAKIRMIPGVNADALNSSLDEARQALQLRAQVADNSKTAMRRFMDSISRETLEGSPMLALRQGKPIEAGQRIVQSVMKTRPIDLERYRAAQYGDIAGALTGPRGAAAEALRQRVLGSGQAPAAVQGGASLAQLLGQGSLLAANQQTPGLGLPLSALLGLPSP